jgi:hypothetical protein
LGVVDEEYKKHKDVVYLRLFGITSSGCGDLTCLRHSLVAGGGCSGSMVSDESDVFSAVALVVVETLVSFGTISPAAVVFSDADVSVNFKVLLSVGGVLLAVSGLLSTAGEALLSTLDSLVRNTIGLNVHR